MDAQQKQTYRIGLFVLAMLVMLGGLILTFGSVPTLFRSLHTYYVEFDEAPGVTQGTPVRRSGVRIGQVTAIELDNATGKVRATLLLSSAYVPKANEEAVVSQSLIAGDTSIDLVTRIEPKAPPPPVPPPAKKAEPDVPMEQEDREVAQAGPPPQIPPMIDRRPLPPGSTIPSRPQVDPRLLLYQASGVIPNAQESLNQIRRSLEQLDRLGPVIEQTIREIGDLARVGREVVPEIRRTNDGLRQALAPAADVVPELQRALEDLRATSRTYNRVGERAENLLLANQDKINKGVDGFIDVIQRANQLLSDENQKNVTATLANAKTTTEELNRLAIDARESIANVRRASVKLDETITSANAFVRELREQAIPLTERGGQLMKQFEGSGAEADRLIRDLRVLVQEFGKADGTVSRLITDPTLYNQLTEVAGLVTKFGPRLDRILRDVEVFADKIARHPESLGAGGVVRPSAGLKEAPGSPAPPTMGVPIYPPRN